MLFYLLERQGVFLDDADMRGCNFTGVIFRFVTARNARHL